MRTRAFAFILATSVASTSITLPPRAVLAQGMDPDTKEAKALFEDGVKLYKAGKYEEARVKFKAAYGLKKRPSIVLNLANAELATKRPLDAIGHFKEVIAMPDAKPDDKEEAKSGLAEARKQVGVIVIDAPTGTAVTIDGEARTAPPDGMIEVMPGAHTVVLKGGTKEHVEKVNLTAGQTVTVSPKADTAPPPPPPPVTPTPTPPPPPETTPPPEPPPTTTTTSTTTTTDVTPSQGFFEGVHPVTYVSAGVAVLAAVGWVGFFMKARTHDANVEKLAEAVQRPTCGTPESIGKVCTRADNKTLYRQQGRDELDSAESARTLSLVFGITTAVAVGATVATYILLRDKPGTKVGFGAAPTWGGATFSLVGEF